VISKAKEFLQLISKNINTDAGFSYKVEEIYHYINRMSNVEWDNLMATIATNRRRNVGKSNLPVYGLHEKLAITELIWDNDICGLHNSYWSRMWWMAKGGLLVKMFPPNSVLEDFECGQRGENYRVYRK